MKEGGLGYATKFVNKPPLKSKHRPAGTIHTPPSLEGRVFHQDQLYKVGYRVRSDAQFELVHVEGNVFPHSESNLFGNLKDGVVSFLSLQAEKP